MMAIAMLDGTDPARPALRALGSCHLLAWQQIGGFGRYRFHDLIREYAQRIVDSADSPEWDRVARIRVLTTMLTLTRRAHRRLYDGDYEVVHSDVADVPVPDECLDLDFAHPLE